MAYTVHEVTKLSGVTIKTLYHYHKIGLLMPEQISENGYRLYGEKELEKLQQILFFRELDFSLEQIKTALDNEPNRLQCLCEQRTLLKARQQRLHSMLHTLDTAIHYAEKGEQMSTQQLFHGLNKQEWGEALAEQNVHLHEAYGFTIPTEALDADDMNVKAAEVSAFMDFMANALRDGVSATADAVQEAISKHIAYLAQSMELDAATFAAQARFFLMDEFHRGMLESQQIGLSYYLCIAAEAYAAQ